MVTAARIAESVFGRCLNLSLVGEMANEEQSRNELRAQLRQLRNAIDAAEEMLNEEERKPF